MLGTKEFLKRLMLHPLLLRWSNQFLFRLLDKLLRDVHSAVLDIPLLVQLKGLSKLLLYLLLCDLRAQEM